MQKNSLLSGLVKLPLRIARKVVGIVTGDKKRPVPPAPRPRPAPAPAPTDDHGHDHGHSHDHDHDHDHGEEPRVEAPPVEAPVEAPPVEAPVEAQEPEALQREKAKKPAAKKPAAKRAEEKKPTAKKPAAKAAPAAVAPPAEAPAAPAEEAAARKPAKVDNAVSVEGTPNPSARKFNLHHKVQAKGSFSFASPEAAAGHELATKLFKVKGVKSVFGVNDFVTVTKADEADWDKVQTLVTRVLQRFDFGA